MAKINRDIKVGLVIALILMLVVALFYYIFNENYKYNWDENYKFDNDQPYGADMLYDFLGSYDKDASVELIEKESISSFLRKKDSVATQKNNTYFIIGNYLDFVARDYETLYDFMEKGNTVMIVSSNIDNALIEKINYNCSDYDSYYYNGLNSTVSFSLKANFENENLKTRRGYNFFYEYLGERYDYQYTYFGSKFCRDQNYETLGEIKPDKVNFIKIKVGEGELLLHTNPIFFTNRHLIRNDGYEYAGKVLSYLPEGNIYWDKQNKPIKIKKPAMEGNEDDTPFTYILKQRSFRWAFYLIYVAVGLFLVFNLFRKQKQIPVLFQNKNTSLEFIKNVGTLYFENKDNKLLAHKIMKHFMNEVRLKYYIKEKDSETIIKKLAQKTTVDIKVIENIFNGYKLVENRAELSDDGLVKFYLKIEKFHKMNAKK